MSDFDQLPNHWSEWPREAKVDYLTLSKTRKDLLAHLRGYIGSDRGSDRLSKEEIAHITVDLEVIV